MGTMDGVVGWHLLACIVRIVQPTPTLQLLGGTVRNQQTGQEFMIGKKMFLVSMSL